MGRSLSSVFQELLHLSDYIIEGDIRELHSDKGMMYQNREAGPSDEKLTRVLIPYLNAQVKAGVQAFKC